jgi:putative membrane protein
MRPVSRLLLAPATALGIVLLAAAPALAAPSGQDASWMQAVHQGNLAEIVAGQAAQQQASNGRVRQLGAMFVQDHTQLDNSLTQAAQQLGVQLPSGPTAQQQQELAAVKQKSGQAFDSAWVSSQTASHQTALAATQQELQAGSDPTVLGLARTAAPVVQKHLTELQNLAGGMGTPTSVNGGTGGQAADDGLRTAGWMIAGLGALVVLAGTAALVRRRTTIG